jgi:hypothetical protein
MSKLFSAALAIGLSWVASGWLSIAQAALVTAAGYTNDFSTQPPVTDWSTRALEGAAGNLTTADQLDAAVQGVSASSVATALGADASADPPPAAGTATWSALGRYVQTRPTGVDATLLMCTLVNGLGLKAAGLNLSYDFTTNGPATEEVPGHRVYYSLTGQPGSWVVLPSLCSAAPGRLSTNLSLSWPAGGTVYLLWADDNGSPSPDPACQIDNVSVTVIPAGPEPAVILASPTNTAAPERGSVTFQVVADGNPAPTYQWFKNDVPIQGATNSSYSLDWVLWSDNGARFYVVVSNWVTNVSYVVTSAVAILTVEPDLEAPSLVQVLPPPDSTVTRLTEIEVTFSEPVTGVDAPDLLINGTPASGLTVRSPAVYVFQFSQPATGQVQVTWASGHGITDLAAAANGFAGTPFSYTLRAALSVADVRITEFMAANTRTLADEDGQYSDWIELQNLGTDFVNLEGWFLTDTPANLRKWSFPATNLGPGQFLVVFASGKDKRVPGAPLHTNFRLDAPGEYLALVWPDGNTIASEFAPRYPIQISDVSYGYGVEQTHFTLVPTNAVVHALVPGDGSLGDAWTLPEFDDRTWLSGTGGVGYDTGGVNPGEDLASSIIQASRPALYFRLNETVGPTAATLGTNGITGTYYNVTFNQPGPRPPTFGGFEPDNYAPVFNGSSAYVGTGRNFMSDLRAFTMAAWIRPTATQAARTGLFGQNDCIEFGFISATDLQIWTPSGGSLNLAYPFPINEWHHVAVVGDGSNLRIYLDGTLRATGGSATTSYGASSYPFNIGGGGVFDASGNWFNGQIDEVAVWLRALTAEEIQQQYQAAINPVSTISYGSLIGLDVRQMMYGVNSSCYIRYLFNVEDVAAVNRLTLNLRYDDGFVAYLNGVLVAARNAPGDLRDPLPWDAAATTYNPDGAAWAGETFNLTAGIGALRPGLNVLAIQGLNTSRTNADFLIAAELIGTTVGAYTPSALRYFTVPTPGNPNGAGVADLGPVITSVGHSPPPPAPITTNDAITVTARVQMAFAPVTNVMLYYRVMWGPTNSLPMFDDGLHGDGAANDGIFGAVIPPAIAAPGQMVRWFVRAWDAQGRVSRWPIFANPDADTEYEGTMIHDPTVNSPLQVWHFFIASDQMSRVDTESGGRVSLFFNGVLYDNIYMELRGNTTAGYPKKSHRVEFNADKPLRGAYPGVEIRKTSLLSETADPSYLRTYLSFWLMEQMGVPSPFDYPVHCRLNGQYWGLWFHNDVMGPDQLQRLGYDPLGALYKAAGQVNPQYSSTGGFEKKTRLWEGRQDYDALAYGVNEARSLEERRRFIFDNLNIPEIINYLAVARWTQEGDDVWANMTLYRDTLGTKEWSIIPFDLNVSWGQLYCGDASSIYNVVIATNDLYKSHPLYGGSQVREFRGANPSAWNRIYDVIIAVPETRQMLLRRERTLLEKFIGPPGQPFGSSIVDQHIAYMTNLLLAEMFADRQRNGWPCTTVCGMYCWSQSGHPWPTNSPYGIPGLFTHFIEPRRVHWWVTHCITNTARPIGLTNTANAGIPISQPANAYIAVHAIEFSPASGNQAEEYICLTNPTPFALDISGWQLDGAVRFTFRPGTVIPSNGTLYVSPDVNAFRARTTGPRGGQGLFVQGPYQGQLSARGETIVVRDDFGRLVSRWSYPPAPSLAQQYLRITELMYNPPPLAGNTNDPQAFEYIELKNISSTETLDLRGVRFVDGIRFDFTSSAVTSLPPGATVLVVKDRAAFVARYGNLPNIAGEYPGYSGGYLDNGGERVRLVDARGEEILDFVYSDQWYPVTDGLGFSLVVVDERADPDAWNTKSQWRPSGRLYGSPGVDDPAPPSIVPVVINEALTRTETPPPTDSIELFNPTSTPADISGWWLSDDFLRPNKYRIPDGTVLAPGAYIVFTEADFNANPNSTNSFALGADGDEVYLFSADAEGQLTGYFHGFQFGAADNNVSFGRLITSEGKEHFVAQAALTLGTNNAGPRVGPVVITEIMYHPPEIGTNDNTLDEFVELQNISAEPVALWDSAQPDRPWKVTGGISFTFPTNLSLAAGEYLLLVNFDPADQAQLAAFRGKFGLPASLKVFGPYGGKLNNDADQIELKKAVTLASGTNTYVLVDKVSYKDTPPWPGGADGFGLSLQRKDPAAYGNDPINWIAAQPSPGATAPRGGTPPIILAQPASQTVLAFWPLTLSVTATGTEPLRYQWRFNGTNLPAATNATLTLDPVRPQNAGRYEVTVYNEFGSACSSNIFLEVTVAAAILAQPVSQTVFPLQSVGFSVVAYSSTPLTYQWQHNGMDVPGATNATYTIPIVQPTHAGQYRVVVTDAAGSTPSAEATLTVLTAPIFTRHPTNAFAALGSNVTFSVMATSTTPVRYQWLHNGEPISGATNPTLTLVNVQLTDAGTYAAVATDGYGSATSAPATLTVLVKPAITANPANQTVAVGATVRFSVEATGTEPLWYRWRKNAGTYLWPGEPTLEIPNVTLSDAGTYDVIVTNLANALLGGFSRSSNAYLLVVDLPARYAGAVGSNVTLRAVVSLPRGFTSPFLWKRGDTTLRAGTNTSTTTLTMFTNDLVLTNFSADQAGTYSFILTNSLGAPATFHTVVSVLDTNPVSLAVELQATNAVISWPATGATWTLEQTDQLGPSADWQPVNTAPILVGERWQVTVPVSDSATRFFRLKRP